MNQHLKENTESAVLIFIFFYQEQCPVDLLEGGLKMCIYTHK